VLCVFFFFLVHDVTDYFPANIQYFSSRFFLYIRKGCVFCVHIYAKMRVYFILMESFLKFLLDGK